MPLTLEYIRWAYRILLDREPESDNVIAPHRDACENTKQLRERIFDSAEYLDNNPKAVPVDIPGRGGRLPIELDASPEKLTKLFSRVESTWRAFGEDEAYWSVMSADQFKKDNFDETAKKEFELSGKTDASVVIHTLARNGLDLNEYKTCVEIGCGVGRVTRWLSPLFEKVHAFDISQNHIDIAGSSLKESNIANVELQRFSSFDQMSQLPKCDFVFSVIVLQHNPPPVIKYMIQSLLACLKPGGVALFQVPTYFRHYSFEINTYLDSPLDAEGLEMHAIPQCEVFKIVEESNCYPVEVVEDSCIGRYPGSVSNTFFIKKRS